LDAGRRRPAAAARGRAALRGRVHLARDLHGTATDRAAAARSRPLGRDRPLPRRGPQQPRPLASTRQSWQDAAVGQRYEVIRTEDPLETHLLVDHEAKARVALAPARGG